MRQHDLWAAFAVLLLAGCNSQQPDEDQSSANAPAAAGAEANPSASQYAALVYPGSKASGDRFSTGDPVDRVVAWYWDEEQPMRERDGQTWAVSKPERRDGGYLVQLTILGNSGGQSFAVYLTPNAGGGTDGRVRPITPEEIKSGVKL